MIKPGKAPDYRDREYAKKSTVRLPPIGVRMEKAPVKVAVFETLEDCEKALAAGFQQVAEALARIREARLYKEAGFEDFGDYCEHRLGFGRARGDRLASAHFTLKSLPGHCRKLLANEGQMRAVTAIPKEKRVEVLKQVSKAGPVTAKAISETFQPARRSSPVVIDVEPESRKACPACGGSGFV